MKRRDFLGKASVGAAAGILAAPAIAQSMPESSSEIGWQTSQSCHHGIDNQMMGLLPQFQELCP